jgi:hypothetical protein
MTTQTGIQQADDRQAMTLSADSVSLSLSRGDAKVRCNPAQVARQRAGSMMVEFAFICLAFYLLLAGTLELGRMITVSQAVQNAARVGARELALVPLPPTATFQQALSTPQVRTTIYNPYLLALDVGGGMPNTDAWPLINRMLLPIMIRDRMDLGGGMTDVLHFPGAVLRDTTNGQLTVAVPNVISRDTEGIETIRWLPVLEEVVSNPNDPNSGPFSLASTGPERGLVALRINCPYQASTMTAYRVVGGGPSMLPVHANDGAVTQVNAAPGALLGGAGDPDDLGYAAAYSGPYGLGKMYAMGEGNGGVRPFRRLISQQSIFRREVFGQ